MTEQDAERAHLVAFQHVPYVGPVALGRLRAAFGSATAAWQGDGRRLRTAINERAATSLETVRRAFDVAGTMERLARDGIDVVTIDDDAPQYPALLREIHLPPPVLFVHGSFSKDDGDAVAVVGTRQISPYGRMMTGEIAAGLARAGSTVVSGLAIGVDGVAHQAALDAGGRTIAVLGSGLRNIYPREHRRLVERIAQQGAVVSDYPPDTKPDARNFPARNRLISGLARGVVVIEAPERSGALITVDFAADQGRDVFAVPGPVGGKSDGCNRLIRNGAGLARSAQDVLDDLGVGRTPEQRAVQQELPLGESERLILGALTGAPRHIDEISEEVSLSAAEVASALLMLTLQGLVHDAGAQHYARVGR